ncbi:MAG: hypothetical protein EOP49_51165, partial [Sphingobacteriales bacterium]
MEPHVLIALAILLFVIFIIIGVVIHQKREAGRNQSRLQHGLEDLARQSAGSIDQTIYFRHRALGLDAQQKKLYHFYASEEKQLGRTFDLEPGSTCEVITVEQKSGTGSDREVHVQEIRLCINQVDNWVSFYNEIEDSP